MGAERSSSILRRSEAGRSAVDLLCQEKGYEIYQEGHRVVCIDRRTWILGFMTSVLSTVGFLLLALGLLLWGGALEDVSSSLPPAFLLLSIACFTLAVAFGRMSRRRSRKPTKRVSRRLTLDFDIQQLLDSQGAPLASLETVHAHECFDWATRGLMRVVVLRWPSGRRVVLRTAHRQRARDIARLLGGLPPQC